jgi:hypothetical protein
VKRGVTALVATRSLREIRKESGDGSSLPLVAGQAGEVRKGGQALPGPRPLLRCARFAMAAAGVGLGLGLAQGSAQVKGTSGISRAAQQAMLSMQTRPPAQSEVVLQGRGVSQKSSSWKQIVSPLVVRPQKQSLSSTPQRTKFGQVALIAGQVSWL